MKTNEAMKQSRRRFLRTAGASGAGFARANDFDAGTPVFGKAITEAEVRRTPGIGS